MKNILGNCMNPEEITTFSKRVFWGTKNGKELFLKKIKFTRSFERKWYGVGNWQMVGWHAGMPDDSPPDYMNKCWCDIFHAEKEGTIIGIRTLQDGWTEYDEDLGQVFTAKRYKRALVVVCNMNQKPILIPYYPDGPNIHITFLP